MNNEVNVPEGGMAMAIKALAESLGGVAVARPEWTDFEQQKERLGLAVIAVVASIQGHSDDWVKRDDLPKIIEQVRSQERQLVRERIAECPEYVIPAPNGEREIPVRRLDDVLAALEDPEQPAKLTCNGPDSCRLLRAREADPDPCAADNPEQPALSEGVGSGAEWECCNCGETAPAGTIYWWEPPEPEKEGRLCGDCADWTETEKAAICLRRNGFEWMAGFLTDAAAGKLSSQPAPPPQAVQGEGECSCEHGWIRIGERSWITCVDCFPDCVGDGRSEPPTADTPPQPTGKRLLACQPEKGGEG